MPIKKLADALKQKTHHSHMKCLPCITSLARENLEKLKIQLVLRKRMDKHMDKLRNHITVQSTHDFEKGTRNGKMLHSFSAPVLCFCLPSSL